MIVKLEDAKNYLRVDCDGEDDNLITALILAAEEYLFNATGIKYTAASNIAALYCKILIYDWYKNRQLSTDKKVSDNVRFALTSMITQLKYCGGDLNGTE